MASQPRKSKPPAPLERVATMDHLRARKPKEETIEILLDDPGPEPEQPSRVADAEEKQRYHRQLEAWKARRDELTRVMKFRSMGRKPYEELVGRYPATKEQIERAEKANEDPPIYDADRFAPALIAACASEPALTLEEAQEIWDTFSQGECLHLFTTCLGLNTQSRIASLGKGSGRMPF